MSPAKRNPKRHSSTSGPGPRTAGRQPLRPAPPSPPETVDPRWLLKAGAAVLALGLLCAYISLCALFYHAQWQLVLHPSRAVPQTPASIGLNFVPVRFGDDAAGQPQLAGWWIPSDLPRDPGVQDPTVLLLHGGDGSMSDALPAAEALHKARLNVLLFDYRGYGQSGGGNPSEHQMRADAEAALSYLTATRRIPATSVIPFGTGLGASLAVGLCDRHPGLPAVILESADGDTEARVLQDQRSHIVPIGLLFHERFPLADPLHRLHTPKLLISFTKGDPPLEAARAGDPKVTVELPRETSSEEIARMIQRFVGTYVVQPPSALKPQP